MLPIGIQTRGIINEYLLDDSYSSIKKSGMNCVDFTITLVENKVLEPKEYNKHKDFIKKHELFVSQTHAPLIPCSYELLKENVYWNYLIEQYNKSIEITAILESPYMVMHAMNLAEHIGRDEERRLNLLLFSTLTKYAERNGVMICIENIPLRKDGRSIEGVCSSSQTCIDYIKELNKSCKEGSESFGVCYDIGHANLLGKNLYDEVILLGNHLKVLHLHDNDGIYDSHQLPYSFCTNLGSLGTNWSSFLIALREIDYNGAITFETGRFLSLLPGILQQQALNFIYAMGKNFSDIILFEKKNLIPNKEKEIIIFGAGKMFDVYMKQFGNKYPPLFAVDNNENLWGQKKNSVTIKSPEQILYINKDNRLIIICSGYYDQIIEQLYKMKINDYLLSEEVLRMNGKMF